MDGSITTKEVGNELDGQPIERAIGPTSPE